MCKEKLLRISCLVVVVTLIFGGCGRRARRGVVEPSGSEISSNIDNNSNGNETSKQTTNGAVTPVSNETLEILKSDIDPIDWESEEGPTLEQLKAASKKFYLSNGYEDSSITVNGLKQVEKTGDISVNTLKDELTGEIKYYVASYDVYTKNEDQSDDDYEDDYWSTMYSRLYDAQGKLLVDWEECWYDSCAGNCVVKRENGDFIFKNIVTNKEIKRGIGQLRALTSDRMVLFSMESELFYIVDSDGNILFDAKEIAKDFLAESYCYNVGEYIVVVGMDEESYQIDIYDSTGNKAGYIKDLNSGYIEDNYVMSPYWVCDGKIYDISQLDGGELKPVFAQDEVVYYDRELAICKTYDENDEIVAYLYDINNGKVISNYYTFFSYVGESDISRKDEIKDYFYGLRSDGVDKIDRGGQIVAKVDMNTISSMTIEPVGVSISYDDYEKTAYYDLDFNKKEVTKYESYSALYDYANDKTIPTGLWYGLYYFGKDNSYMRYDLLDNNGNVIVEGISDIGSVQDGTITISRGQSYGVIDFEGNWLIKLGKNEFNNND